MNTSFAGDGLWSDWDNDKKEKMFGSVSQDYDSIVNGIRAVALRSANASL